MPEVKLKTDAGEFPVSGGIVTIGRTPDNKIAFPDDANVSRHHAEIEVRGGEYCLIDLGSSNGTTVNGEKVSGERYLSPGDLILLGGTSRIEFVDAGAAEEEAGSEESESSGAGQPPGAGVPEASEAAAGAAASGGDGGSKTMLLVAGGIAVVALLFVGIAAVVFVFAGSSKGGGTSGSGGGGGGGGGIFSSLFGSPCEAKASITKPETGDSISAPTEIEVDVENGECVAKAVFTIDGNEFASSESPFKATIDPKDFPDLSDGVDHSLGIVLLDEENNPIGQNAPVMLAFETRAVTKPTPGPEVTQTNTQQNQPSSGKAPSLLEIQDMATRLAKQFTSKTGYKITDKQFLTEVQKRTGEYAQEGYYEKAFRYKDVILTAFTREANLDAPLGFILAMSRSKFDPAMVGTEEGLWRMNSKFITDNGYNGTCGGMPVNDPSQSCAAKAAAAYMKFIVTSATDTDPIYGIAVFGKPTNDAAIWFSGVGQNRADIWTSIKTAPEREQLVRFFAAGIVAENPQKFGLKKDQPLSTIYRVAM
jgi:hypothetical protein